jgi:hypothetical protein
MIILYLIDCLLVFFIHEVFIFVNNQYFIYLLKYLAVFITFLYTCFKASASVTVLSSHVWGFTRRHDFIVRNRFWTTFLSNFQGVKVIQKEISGAW